MGPEELFMSKKLTKILKLFTDNKQVPFSKVMSEWGYKSPYSAMAAVAKLIKWEKIVVTIIASTFISLS